MNKKIRYVVIPVDLPDDHPHWPNERVHYIKDTKTGTQSFSCYKSKEQAEQVAGKKNG